MKLGSSLKKKKVGEKLKKSPQLTGENAINSRHLKVFHGFFTHPQTSYVLWETKIFWLERGWPQVGHRLAIGWPQVSHRLAIGWP